MSAPNVKWTHGPGDLIALSSGEYSDYRFNGLYVVKQPIDLGSLAVEYAANAPLDNCWADTPEADREAWMYDVSDTGFGAFLIARGLVDEVEYDEVHCGSTFDASMVNADMASRRASRATAEAPAGAQNESNGGGE